MHHYPHGAVMFVSYFPGDRSECGSPVSTGPTLAFPKQPSIESFFPAYKSDSETDGSTISESNKTTLAAAQISSYSIVSIFPPANSFKSDADYGSSVSNEPTPDFSKQLSIPSFFPPDLSESDTNENYETQSSYSIVSFFPPARSPTDSSEYYEIIPTDPSISTTVDYIFDKFWRYQPVELEDDIWRLAMSSLESKSIVKSDDCDFVYISEILQASIFLSEDSDIFLLLEKQQYLKGKDTSKVSTLQRRLIFDTINEILDRNRQLPPWKPNSWTSPATLQPIWSEFQRMQERDASKDLFEVICGDLRKDVVMGDAICGWVDCSIAMSEAVLNIERQIFMDLIGETIGDLAVPSHDGDFVYISEILWASIYLPEDSDIFLLLEKQQYLKGKDTSKVSRLQRRLIFDTINEILDRNRQVPPWKPNSWTSSATLQQIWSEFQKIQERDASKGLFEVICGDLRKDVVMGDAICGWVDRSIAMSEAVLNIERQIFMDLIGETIGDLAVLSGDCNKVSALRRKKLPFRQNLLNGTFKKKNWVNIICSKLFR